MLLGTTANAAVGEFEEAAEGSASLIHDEGLLDPHFPLRELILDDGVFGIVLCE